MVSKELQAAIDAAWAGVNDKTLTWDERRIHLADGLELWGDHDDATVPTGYQGSERDWLNEVNGFADSWPYGTGSHTEADAEAVRAERDPPLHGPNPANVTESPVS